MSAYFTLFTGTTRYNAHKSTLELLLRHLDQVISGLPIQKLETLLEASFGYMSFEELRPISIAILHKLPQIPVHYLQQISQNEDVLDKLPRSIQRKVWEVVPALTHKIFQPRIEAYVSHPDRIAHNFQLLQRLSSTHGRSKDKAFLEIIDMIGESEKLYLTVLSMLRTGFIKTKNVGYCSMRMDLLMTLHDRNWPQLEARDPCHQYAWCLDACARDNRFDKRIVDKLVTYLGAVPPNHPVVGDLAMIAASPAVRNVLLSSAMCAMDEIIDAEAIPQHHEALLFVTNLIYLGTHAHRIISTQDFNLPQPDQHVGNIFYPLLANEIMLAKLQDDSETISAKFSSFINDCALRNIVCFYIVSKLAKASDGSHALQAARQVHILELYSIADP